MSDNMNENHDDVMDSATAAAQEIANNSPTEDSQSVASSPSLMDFSDQPEKTSLDGPANGSGENINMLMDVNLQFTVELGRTQMPVRQILELQNGSVVELDRVAGEAVDVYINEHLMARGEVVVVDDKFGVRITELISPTKGK